MRLRNAVISLAAGGLTIQRTKAEIHKINSYEHEIFIECSSLTGCLGLV